MIRAVVDVNVLVSALLTPRGTPRRVLDAWEAARFVAITSEALIALVVEKLRSPRIGRAYGVTDEEIRWVVALLRTQAEVVIVPREAELAVAGDPEDDHVLATGIVGQADYVVTGDRRLLTLESHQGMRIVGPRAFLASLDAGS